MIIVNVCAYGVDSHLSVSWAVSGPLYPIGVVHAFRLWRFEMMEPKESESAFAKGCRRKECQTKKVVFL